MDLSALPDLSFSSGHTLLAIVFLTIWSTEMDIRFWMVGYEQH